MKTMKLTLMAMTMAVAMILSYIESQLPPLFVAVPAIKMGLANIAVVYALYSLGFPAAVLISLLRVFLVSVMFSPFGLAGLLYGGPGAALSLLGMALMKKTGLFSTVGVSVTGGVLHNIGQIAMACVLLGTAQIAYYLPVLLVSGTVAGVLTGLAAAVLIKRIHIKGD